MPGEAGRGYVIDVQADLLRQLKTRTVVPLVAQTSAPPPIRYLNPVFHIEGEPHLMLTQAIASIQAKELREAVASLEEHHDDITRALDVLFSGL